MQPLLLIGSGGHARSVLDVIETLSNFYVHGLIGLPSEVGSTVLGYKVIGTDDDLNILRRDVPSAVIALGQIKTSESRRRIAIQLQNLRFSMPPIISASARVSKHATIAEGTVIHHNAVINSSVSIGKHSIINTSALLEHDVAIGDFCHVSTGALVNGGVKLGSDSFIGSGAIIREGVSLPASTVVSAGHRIMKWPPT